MIKNAGKRKTPDGWVRVTENAPPTPDREIDPAILVGLEDLVEHLPAAYRPICRRLAQGDSLFEIAREIAQSFDASTRWRSEAERIHDRLREDLAHELRRLLDDE